MLGRGLGAKISQNPGVAAGKSPNPSPLGGPGGEEPLPSPLGGPGGPDRSPFPLPVGEVRLWEFVAAPPLFEDDAGRRGGDAGGARAILYRRSGMEGRGDNKSSILVRPVSTWVSIGSEPEDRLSIGAEGPGAELAMVEFTIACGTDAGSG